MFSRFLEEWLGYAILWLACRRHVADLHLKAVCLHFMGATKDPGVELFRRFRDEWHSLNIDQKELVLWNWDSASENMKNLARRVLVWGENELVKGTFPRDDYREYLELVVISLGGKVSGFTFKLPGNDSNARWMAKSIYNLKIRLLSKVFLMSSEENTFVEKIAQFCMIFYPRFWLTTPLPWAAPREDLGFIYNLEEYRKLDPRLFFALMKSVYLHLWYLTPALVVLALFDKETESEQKEEMARALHQTPRGVIDTGKPTFPIVEPGARYKLANFVGPESWLIFDLFDMTGEQDWLLAPSSNWHLSSDFRKLEEYALSLVCVNDLAERGCHMATEFIKRVESEEQRTALWQCLEDYRVKVPTTNKQDLKLA